MADSPARLNDASAPAVAPTKTYGVALSTTSSGNVFADLGFENSEDEQIKADPVLELAEVIERRRLSRTAAARIIGLSQPNLPKLLRGRTGGYSLERLLALTRALGSDVEIIVRRSKLTQPGKLHLRVIESV